MSESVEADDPDLLAAEYVLGVLDSAEMTEVRRRALAEPALQASIAAWETRLAPLAGVVAPVAPPADLWPRIERGLAAGGANDSGANDSANVVRPSGFGRVARNAGLWQATTAAALALAAAFAAVAYLPRTEPVAAPSRFAALAPLGGPAPAFLAELRPNGALLISAISPAPVPAGRDLELWVLPRGGTVPKPLGVFPAGGQQMVLAEAPPADAQLLVSLEPQGGSPTGLPTGPVLYGVTLAIR